MCEILSGITDANCVSKGGYDYAIFYDPRNIDTLTVASGAVSALTLTAGKNGFMVKLDAQMISGEDNGTFNRETGGLKFDQTTVLTFKEDTAALTAWLEEVEGSPISVILVTEEDNDGVSRILGLKNGLTGAGASTYGAKYEEGKVTALTLTGEEPKRAPSIANTLATSILA